MIYRGADGGNAQVTGEPVGDRDPVVAPHHVGQIREFVSRLSGRSPRVVLADGEDDRAVAAAGWLAEHTPVRPVLLAVGERSDPSVPTRDTTGVETWDIAALAEDPAVLAALRSRPDGSTRPEQEVATMAADPVYLAAAQVSAKHAAACLADTWAAAR